MEGQRGIVKLRTATNDGLRNGRGPWRQMCIRPAATNMFSQIKLIIHAGKKGVKLLGLYEKFIKGNNFNIFGIPPKQFEGL